jgi:hypothetical protein
MTAMTLCAGEPCLLREDGVGSNFLARLLLRVLAGDESVQDLVTARPAFAPKEQCVECAMRVMRDGQPLLTIEAYQQSVEAGRRSRARWRRRRSRGDHGVPSSPGTAAHASFVGLNGPRVP